VAAGGASLCAMVRDFSRESTEVRSNWTNVAPTGELGIIMAELSAMRRQLTFVEASVGSFKRDLGFLRDSVATPHEDLKERTSLFSANNLVTTSLDPLRRRASTCEPKRNRPRVSRVSRTSANVASSAQAEDVPRSSMLGKMAELEVQKIFRSNNEQTEIEESQSTKAQTRLGSLGSASKSPILVKLVKNMDGHDLENVLDTVVGFFIVLNAIFLGMSADAGNPAALAYRAIDVTFAAIFWVELTIKVKVKGFHGQYCDKKDRFSNLFDAFLILIDSISIFLELFFSDLLRAGSGNEAMAVASLFRIVRLMRLARILRLLRSRVFQDLLSMIQGMLGGLATLGWSVVLFVIFIYVVSLVFRILLGPDRNSVPEGSEEAEQVQTYFEDVPRSMFTMVRCSFGDCTTDGGTPIFEHVTLFRGGVWSFVYSCFNFIVVIGLFNVISAIFVESTMAAAANLQAKKRQERLSDEQRWAVNFVMLLRTLMLEIYGQTNDVDEGRINDILQVEFYRKDFDYVLKEKESAQHALIELDIDPQDNKYLSDILDPDNSGTIGVLELVDGLKRLRGEPRRSDTIAIDLMVRSLQEKIDDIWRGLRCDRLKQQNVQEAAALQKRPTGSLMSC